MSRDNVPDEFKIIKEFGQFYDRVIIDFGNECVKSKYPFINFDGHQMQLLYEAWEEYGVINRPDIAYNITMIVLRKYTDTVETNLDVKEE